MGVVVHSALSASFRDHLCVCVFLSVSGGVTTAHQVPAVSQSAYSPPTPETPDSLLSTPPQTLMTKNLPLTLSEHSLPSITSLPPTQPTAKVRDAELVSRLL